MAVNALELTFLDPSGKTKVLKLNNALPNLSEDAVYQAMAEIVRLNLFTGKDGRPLYERFYKAAYVSNDEKVVYKNNAVKK
ncbi:DUF2922 domain-containing protein [Lactobacillaceae bacterium Melli_B4]